MPPPRPIHLWTRLVPPLRGDAHKGQAGRVAVVGGSREYTGAPFYAAMASLRAGGDLAFVFCGSRDAAGPIKAYSPELIVFPGMRKEEDLSDEVLGRLTSVVVGPGLGRASAALEDAAGVIQRARARGKPLVLDGDALWLLKERPKLLLAPASAQERPVPVVLTPNKMEFERLYVTLFGGKAEDVPPNPFVSAVAATPPPFPEGAFVDPDLDPLAAPVSRLARALGEGVVVVRKGPTDVISDGKTAVLVSGSGSQRRCGGQGDVLAGVLGQFLSWTDDGVLAAYGASALTRHANHLAFMKHGRGMVTPDMIAHVADAFRAGFESSSCSSSSPAAL